MKTLLPLIFALFFLCLPAGCAVGRHVVTPAARSTAGAASIMQTGDAAKPAQAATNTQSASVPIPAGSTVVFNDKLGTLAVTLSGETILHTETRTDTVTGPQAFTPPAPPTPTDEAKGKAALWLRIGLVVGIAAGGFGLVERWSLVALGGGSVAAACFLGLSIEAIPGWLWAVLGIGGALAVAGPIIWHTKVKPAASPHPSA